MNDGRFLIGQALGQGGFGITYRGLDVRLNRIVAIKEYYPTALVTRNQSRLVECYTDAQRPAYEKSRDQFLREAQTLARLDRIDEIVNILDYFPANNTAYIVMEYLEGKTLSQMVTQDGPMSPETTLILLKPILRALAAMHAQGIIHRDISPDNLMMLKNGKVKLLDLGCARDIETSAMMSVMLKPGYAPVEQYTGSDQGPWTDIYALCATAYYLMTGLVPPASLMRRERPIPTLGELGVPIDSSQEAVLLRGLALEARDRWQDVGSLYGALYGETFDLPVLTPVLTPGFGVGTVNDQAADSGTSEAVSSTVMAEKPRIPRRVMVFLLLLLAALGLILFGLFGPEDEAPPELPSDSPVGQQTNKQAKGQTEEQTDGQTEDAGIGTDGATDEQENPDEESNPVEDELDILWKQLDALPIGTDES